jgi:GT2 family glycosyltransferase
MKISVVIPTCDRPDALAACLLRLAPDLQALPADAFEIIVSDDGRGQPVSAVLGPEFPGVRWVAGPRRGPAANRNAGALAAGGELLVFLDDDCLPEPGLLSAYAAAFADPALQAAEGRISPDREPNRLDEVAPVNENGGVFWSCNVALRRDLFERIGGFDERFPHAAMEDVELRNRLRLLKVRIAFLPGAAVIHPLRRQSGDRESLLRRARAHGLYIRIEGSHLRPYTPGVAARIFLRKWLRQIAPKIWCHRGRGFWPRAKASLLPFYCMVEMRRAARLPKLPLWSQAER